MATYSLSALQRSRRKFMRIYWVAGLRKWRPTGSFRPRVCKNTFLSCVPQPIALGRGDFPITYHDQRW